MALISAQPKSPPLRGQHASASNTTESGLLPPSPTPAGRFGMELLDVYRVLLGSPVEGLAGTLKQLRLPLHDRVRMHVEAFRQLGDGLIALDRG